MVLPVPDAPETEINTIKNTHPHFFVKTFEEESLKFKIKAGNLPEAPETEAPPIASGLVADWNMKVGT